MLHSSEIILRLLAATLIGAGIGLNREFHHKQSGLKTLGLVGMGSALCIIAVVENSPSPDAYARVIQGIVVGVGFIGAGVIIKHDGDYGVRGLTTAAAVWLTACLGVACGAGAWVGVMTTVVLAALLFSVGARMEKAFRAALGQHHLDDDSTPSQ